MNVHVINLARYKLELHKVLIWCVAEFGSLTRVQSPTIGQLHQVAYDDQIPGIVTFYFRNDEDYIFFLLKWT